MGEQAMFKTVAKFATRLNAYARRLRNPFKLAFVLQGRVRRTQCSKLGCKTINLDQTSPTASYMSPATRTRRVATRNFKLTGGDVLGQACFCVQPCSDRGARSDNRATEVSKTEPRTRTIASPFRTNSESEPTTTSVMVRTWLKAAR